MDYHFTTKHQFELDIAAGKFVEYGEFGKNLYGISLESISSVVNEGRICILNLHPQVKLSIWIKYLIDLILDIN